MNQDLVDVEGGPVLRDEVPEDRQDLLDVVLQLGHVLGVDFLRRRERALVPGGSVHEERAKFRRLVLGCIEADVCK